MNLQKKSIVQKSLPTGLFFATYEWPFLDCSYCWLRLEWEYRVCSCCTTQIPSNLSYIFYLHQLCLTPCRFLLWNMVPFIPHITFSFIPWQGVDVKRVQFPVRLCFTVTIHRSQGEMLNKVVLYFAGMFSCADAYTSAYLGFLNPPTSQFDDRERDLPIQ